MLLRPLPELVAAFEDATLPRAEWTHEAHLGVALTFYRTEGDAAQVLKRMRAAICRYNLATGVENGPMSGYHETLTAFWVGRVTTFANQHLGTPEAILPMLMEQWGDVRAPLRFYSKRVLMNPTARARFVEPDLAPIDG